MTNQDPWVDSQSDSPAPAKKKGMSGCMLASLIVGGLGLVCMLVCCGGAAWFGSMMVPTVTKEPAEVTAVSKKVLNTEILEDFKPEDAITFDNMIFTMRIAKFKHKEGKGAMMIGQLKLKIGDPKQANPQMKQSREKIEEEMRGSLDIKKTESHDITINAQKVSVAIGDAVDRTNSKTVHTASADFDQPAGQTFFFIRMDEDVWNQDAVLKMLEDSKPAE